MQIGILKNTARVELYQDLLVQLKVPVMANVLGKLANDPAHQNMTLVEAVATMASQERESRAQKRQERFIQRSGLRELCVWNQADVTNVILTKERNLKEQDLRRLMTCEWIDHGKNVLVSGATGTGKTWMLAVLGKQACIYGCRTQYYRYPRLLELLADAREHRESATFRRNLNRNKLLIIDDFGTSSISDDLASDLLTVLEEREGTASVEIGSQLPFNEWHRYLGGNRNADAIMDRLLNSSYQFELEGPSLRERSALD